MIRVHIGEIDFGREAVIVIGMDGPNGTFYQASVEHGAVHLSPVDEGVVPTPTMRIGAQYKDELLTALHAALEEYINGRTPVPDVAQLQESLAVERARVDMILAHALRPPTIVAGGTVQYPTDL